MKHLFLLKWQQVALCAILLFAAHVSFAQQNTLTLPGNQNQWAGIVTAAGVPLSVSVDNATPMATIMINTFTQPNGLAGTVHSTVGLGNKSLEVRDVSEAMQSCAGQGGLFVTGIARAPGMVTGNMFVALVQANGAVCWYYEHTNSTTIAEEGVSVVTMPNGDVIAVGNTSNQQLNATSVLAARFNPLGVMMWSNYYNCNCTIVNPPPAGGNEPTNVYTQGCNLLAREACLDRTGGTGNIVDATGAMSNPGVAVVGNFGNGTAANPNSTMVLTINALGAEMWRNSYGYNNMNIITYDEGHDIIQDNSPNGAYGFGVAGKAISTTGSNYPYFIRMNSMGVATCNTVIRPLQTTTMANFHARGIQLSNTAGNFILAGPDFTTGNTFALEMGACGTGPVWSRTYPLTSTNGGAESISRTTAGYFITTNNMSTASAQNQHILMTDFTGMTGNCISNFMETTKSYTASMLTLAKCQTATPSWLADAPFFAAIPVTENPCPTITVPCDPNFHVMVNSITICPNSCGTLNAMPMGGTAPYTFNWSNGVTAASNTVCTPGTYIVTITDANGCTATATAVVNAAPSTLVTITTSGMITCTSPCVTLTATATGVAPFGYNWSTGSTSATATACTAGVYTVSVTDGNGCVTVMTFTVTSNALIPAVSITGNTTICCNATTTLTAGATGGTSPYTYSWSNGATTPAVTIAPVTPCASSVYTVTVTGANGCTATKSVTITRIAPPIPTITVVNGTAPCTKTLTATGGVTYVWSNGGTTASTTTTAAGIYTVTVTNQAGCTATATVTVVCCSLTATVSAGTAGTSAILTCTTPCITLYGIAASGTAPYSYNWSTAATTPSISVCAAGVYTVTITDAAGCIATSSITVTANNTAPIVTITGSTTICCGATATLSASATSGTTPYTYSWSNGATTAAITIPPVTPCATASTYTVTVTGANGCTATKSVTITRVSPPIAAITVVNGASPCTKTLTATGGVTYVWSNGGTTASTTTTAAGIYTVTVTNQAGCTATASVTVACCTLTAGITTNVTGTAAATLTCTTPCIILNAVPTGGTAPYSYNWSTTATTASISVCAAGVYTVTITDATGCIATSSITVVANNTPPIVSIAGNTIVCCDRDVVLTASATSGTTPYTYLWSNGATSATVVIPPVVPCATASTYTVTVTGANGCTATKSITITRISPPIAAITVSGAGCPKTLTATGGVTYVWSNGATTASATATATGIYTVTVTNQAGCTATATVSVTCCNLTAAIGNTATGTVFAITCANPCVTLNAIATGGTAPFSFNWSGGSPLTMPTTTVCNSGTYTVTIMDANGCTATASATVINNAVSLAVTATSSGNIGCTNCVTLMSNSPIAGTTSVWSNGMTGSPITICIPGTYTVTVTDPATGCTGTASVTVISTGVSLAITATSSGNITCTNPCVTLTAGSFVAGATSVWSNGMTGSPITVCAAGTYTVTVTDPATGCTGTASVTVTGSSTPLTPCPFTYTVDCAYRKIYFNYPAGTACINPNYTYTWTANGVVFSTSSGATAVLPVFNMPASANCNDTFNICLTVSIAGTNCTGQYCTTVVPRCCNPVITHVVDCANNLFVTSVAGYPAGTVFNWVLRPCNAATPVFYCTSASMADTLKKALTPGCWRLCLNLPNCPTNCLAACDTFTVYPSTCCNMQVGITANTIRPCANSQVVLTATPCATCTYQWGVNCSGGTTFTPIVGATGSTFTPPISTTTTPCVYIVTVTNSVGCTATATITIYPPTPITVIITAPTSACVGQIVNAVATGGVTYAWSGCSALGSGTGATYALSSTLPSSCIYTVTATDANGCTGTATRAITFNAAPTATIVKTGTACPYTLTASGGGTYAWSTGATTAAISSTATGTYTVTVTNSFGCTATASIYVDCCNLNITELRYTVYAGSQGINFVAPSVTGCAAGSVLTYLWDFGDGTTSTLAAPGLHTYATPGMKTVCLTVKCTKADGTFCLARCCRDVNVGKPCSSLTLPTFSFTSLATGTTFTFTGTAIPAGAVATSDWTVIDAANVVIATGTGNNLTYTFPAAGEYTVCRTLTTIADANFGNYCSTKHCKKVSVVATTGCNALARFYGLMFKSTPLTVNFTSNSVGATTYLWEYSSTSPTGPFTAFGGGIINPIFTFPAAGIYWVRLTINKGTPCENTITARLNLASMTCTSGSNLVPIARTVNPDGSIEVLNSDINEGIALYPNPTEGNVTVTFGNDIKGTTMIKVYDMKGQLVTSFRTQDGENQTSIDLSNQASGVYLFNIENENGERLVKKVIKE